MASITGYSEALFVAGAAIVTLVPRPASSFNWIGGDLAAPFRKSLLFLAAMNISRNVSFEDRRFREACPSPESSNSMIPNTGFWTVLYYVLTSIESFGLCFLMLLMPYLVQKRLSDVINIRPGHNLMPWLQAILTLNVLGTMTAPYNRNLWAFKRFGDALGCIPVIKTLQLFRRTNSSSAEQGNHLMIKTLEALEGYSFVITTMAAAAYLFDNHHSMVNVAIRLVSIFISWVRVIFHGHLLNAMDDASYIPPRPFGAKYDDEPTDPEVIDDGHQLVVPVTPVRVR
ncbi:hypothetical protein ACHAWX_000304 [Stephanocyclus meneghinianus]